MCAGVRVGGALLGDPCGGGGCSALGKLAVAVLGGALHGGQSGGAQQQGPLATSCLQGGGEGAAASPRPQRRLIPASRKVAHQQGLHGCAV